MRLYLGMNQWKGSPLPEHTDLSRWPVHFGRSE